MVVLPDADLDLAADAAVNAGFWPAGERCMAISALVAVGPVADDLVARIAERAKTIRTGDGTRDADMGPLVTRAHRDRVASYVEAGESAGATVVLDGRTVEADGAADGFWLGPTILDHVTPEMSVYTDEIFGPVLSVLRVESYEEAMALLNANPYGNGTALFTNDGGAARRFHNEVEVGMVGINVPIPVPMAYYSFGGWKNSLFGDSPRARHRRRALLHPHQGRHHPLARPQPRRPESRFPAEPLTPRKDHHDPFRTDSPPRRHANRPPALTHWTASTSSTPGRRRRH